MSDGSESWGWRRTSKLPGHCNALDRRFRDARFHDLLPIGLEAFNARHATSSKLCSHKSLNLKACSTESGVRSTHALMANVYDGGAVENSLRRAQLNWCTGQT